MDTTVLVERHLEEGKVLLEHLLKRKWKISAAFWYREEDADKWKLYLSIPISKSRGPREVYTRLTQVIRDLTEELSLKTFDITVISNYSDTVKSVIAGVKNVKGDEYLESVHLSGDSRFFGQAICYSLDSIKKMSAA